VETARVYGKYLDLNKLDVHSREGMVDLNYDPSWPESVTPIFETSKEWGVSNVPHTVPLVDRTSR
jgi:hypothetical protein